MNFLHERRIVTAEMPARLTRRPVRHSRKSISA
jgi:hypothetical protein